MVLPQTTAYKPILLITLWIFMIFKKSFILGGGFEGIFWALKRQSVAFRQGYETKEAGKKILCFKSCAENPHLRNWDFMCSVKQSQVLLQGNHLTMNTTHCRSQPMVFLYDSSPNKKKIKKIGREREKERKMSINSPLQVISDPETVIKFSLQSS